MRKAAKAAGVKLSTVTPVVSTVSTVQNSLGTTPTQDVESGPTQPEKKPGFSTGGWSTVGSSSSGGGFKKPGWTTVSSLKPPSPPPPPPSHVAPIPPPLAATPGFRSGGWTTLEGPPSASSQNRPSTPNIYHQPPSISEPPPTPNPPDPPTSGFKLIPVAEKPSQIKPQPTHRPAKKVASERAESSRSGWQNFNRGGARR